MTRRFLGGRNEPKGKKQKSDIYSMARYEKYLVHPSTGERALIKSNDYFLYQQKIERQLARWERADEKRAIAKAKRNLAERKAAKAEEAEERTREAQELLEAYGAVLAATLEKNDRIDWAELKDRKTFHQYKPKSGPSEEKFFESVPKKSWLEMFLPFLRSKRERLESTARQSLDAAIARHVGEEEERKRAYDKERTEYNAKQSEFNASIDSMQSKFEGGDPATIEHYLNMVLERSEYPDGVSLAHDLKYSSKEKSLELETQLPTIDELQLVSQVKYIASRDEFQAKMLGKSDSKKLYQSVVNQVVIRTIHEILEAEYFGHVQRVVFSGYLQGTDPRTGNEARVVVLSLAVERDSFMQLNLGKLLPEKCVESLGGGLEKNAYEFTSAQKAS